MLFYFSGTGNTRYVATTLSNILGLKLIFIPECDPSELEMPEERVLFVFPVYSWGVPPLVLDFIEKIKPEFWERIVSKGISVDCVMSCGDETAMAPEMLRKALRKRGVALNSVWSVIMPNNYVLLPGFNVDSKIIEETKLSSSPRRIIEIAEALGHFEKREDVTRGSMPWLKTTLVYPLFKRWGIFPKKWQYNVSCISCGKCAKVCPMLNVKMKKEHPEWGSRCCSCLACYHICPVHAVEYGKETSKKGQYFFPLKRI